MSSSAIHRQPVEGARAHPAALDASVVDDLAQARCADPFALLGPHEAPQGRSVRVFAPGALGVEALDATEAYAVATFDLLDERGLFGALVPGDRAYLLRTIWPGLVAQTINVRSARFVRIVSRMGRPRQTGIANATFLGPAF